MKWIVSSYKPHAHCFRFSFLGFKFKSLCGRLVLREMKGKGSRYRKFDGWCWTCIKGFEDAGGDMGACKIKHFS